MSPPARLDTLDGLPFSAEFVEAVPIDYARRYSLIGFAADGGGVTVAMGSDESWDGLENLDRLLGGAVRPVEADDAQVQRAINSAYEKREGQARQVIEGIGGDAAAEAAALPPREDLLDGGERAPVIRLVNTILFEAVVARASDVHVQPHEDRVVVRNRLDGMLMDALEIPKHLQEEVVTRIKVLGGMNIAEKRLPQDGRASVEVGDRLVDLRIASMPTSHGERVVVRLLDKSAQLYRPEDLGLAEDVDRRWRRLIAAQHGLILVTGPTGSGKSTTLYSSLAEISTADRNVLTLEDPIEYQLDGVSQTQINVKKGMTFAGGLRSILRQDPDIIMVGEVRDGETAEMAVQSALTGHLVFSTLHTNDAASAVTRLLDLGIEPYLVASSLLGVLAQRLVRRNCPKCLRPYRPDPEILASFGGAGLPEGAAPMRGEGCDDCRGTGYRGRFVVTELLLVDETVRGLVQDRANATDVMAAALAAGTRAMSHDGLLKVAAGRTTVEEVARVTVRAAV